MIYSTCVKNTISRRDWRYYWKISDFHNEVLVGCRIEADKAASERKALHALSASILQPTRIEADKAASERKALHAQIICCHSIALALSIRFPELRTVHGTFIGLKQLGQPKDRQRSRPRFQPITCAHSWNVTPDGMIVDSYPVGMLSCAPVFVASKGMYKTFGAGLHVECAAIKRKIDLPRQMRAARRMCRCAKMAREAK